MMCSDVFERGMCLLGFRRLLPSLPPLLTPVFTYYSTYREIIQSFFILFYFLPLDMSADSYRPFLFLFFFVVRVRTH